MSETTFHKLALFTTDGLVQAVPFEVVIVDPVVHLDWTEEE